VIAAAIAAVSNPGVLGMVSLLLSLVAVL